MKHFRLTKVVLGILLVAAGVLAPVSRVSAGTDNGYLIDNVVYYNKSAMNVGQINAFINQFPNSCLLPTNYPSGLSWATFREPIGYFDYSDTDASPAQIIWDVSQYYSINPQVILTTLEKEQNLISGSTGCATWKYNSSMGYNCPDSGGLYSYPSLGVTNTCVQKDVNVTFSRQVNHAAWQLSFDGKRAEGDLSWMGDDATYYYGRMTEGLRARVSGGASSYYDGYTTIDGSAVYLRNGATAALYNYTPHFNSFQAIFSKWFGSVYAYIALDTPRWMKLSHDLQKVDTTTGLATGDQIAGGTQLKFVDKVYLNGVWYLRTEFDSSSRIDKAITLADLEEISYEPFSEPRYMMLNKDEKKFNPAAEFANSSLFTKGTYAKFTSKILINGSWYYRTEFDDANGNNSAFPAAAVSDISLQPADTPHYMRVSQGTRFTNLRTGETSSTTAAPTDLFIAKKVLLNNTWYYQIKADADAANNVAFPSGNASEIQFSAIETPYSIKMSNASTKYNPFTGDALTSQSLSLNQVISVNHFITVNGVSYYQSNWDYTHGNPYGIKTSDTTAASLSFIPMTNPRYITTNTTVKKLDPLTGLTSDYVIPAGTSIMFDSKTQYAGQWYLRTTFDTSKNLNTVISMAQLNL